MVISWEAGSGTREAERGKRNAGSGKREAGCSCNLQQLSREIGEYVGTAGCEVNIILDTNSAPARTVDAGLDRHHCALSEQGFDGFRQPWRFVYLESEAVTEAVPERVAIATVLNVASSQTVGFLPLHARAHRVRGDLVGVTHDLVNLALLRRRPAHYHCAS